MTVPRTDRNIASTKEINLNDAYQESIMTKLSILAYADDKDKDFREQIRAYGKKLPERFSEVLKEIVNKENLMNAIALSNLEMNALSLVTPGLAGLIIDTFDFQAVYYLITGFYLYQTIFFMFIPFFY